MTQAETRRRFEAMDERLAYVEETVSDLLQLVLETRAEIAKVKKQPPRSRRSTNRKRRR
jgi:uncharacterized coiled-coil protein SlyX